MSMTNAQKQQRKPRFIRNQTTDIQLQERDARIIHHVYQHRLLSSRHIMALEPDNPRVSCGASTSFFHAGYLDRPPEQNRPFEAGSEPMVYGLGNKGADLLVQKFKIPRSKVDWTSKNREVKRIFLEHTLEVSHFMVTLELACRLTRGVELIQPEQILACMPALGRNQNNPFSWQLTTQRVFHGVERTLRFAVVPDKVFGLYFPNDVPSRQRAHFFLEADRSTYPIKTSKFYRSSMFKKFVGYWDSYEKGIYPKNFGFKTARVLVVAKSRDRIKNMIRACREADPQKTGQRMFLFTQGKEFTLENPHRIFEDVWLNARDSQPVSILA